MVVRSTCGEETDRTNTNEDETVSKMEKSKKQPEREILSNVESPEIRKIRNNKQKTRFTQRSRQKKRKSGKQNSRTKQRKQKQIQNKTQSKEMRRGKCDLGVMGSAMEVRKRQEITPGCVDRVGCVVRRCDTMRVKICKAWAAI